MKNKILVTLALVAGLTSSLWAERPSVEATVPMTYEQDGGKLLYRFHAPKTLEEGRKYPLVVLLHGAGERSAGARRCSSSPARCRRTPSGSTTPGMRGPTG